MATISYSLSIAGTACPWKLGSGSANINGSSGILVPYNTANWDGAAAAGGSAGQNAAYVYGKLHTHAGETSPTTLSVTPGQIIFLEYVSGTVNTGAGSAGPAGAATTGVSPYPAGGDDNETLPTNVIKGYTGINATGTVNTSGTAVTWASGTKFTGAMISNPIWINNVAYTISTINSPTSITLTATAGTQTGVAYLYWGAKTSIGGLIGAFTDASGDVITNFDWASFGGVTPPSAITLTAVFANGGGYATYSGSFSAGGTNLYEGYWFTITGFANPQNNGTFYCIGNNTATVNLFNPDSIGETHAGSAQLISGITLRVPAGATTLSLGINDTQLYDNTGSFNLTAVVMDAVGWVHDINPFVQAPVGPLAAICGDLWQGDQSSHLKGIGYTLAPAGIAQMPPAQKHLLKDTVGQLYPKGKN